jgi:hypothetical protein
VWFSVLILVPGSDTLDFLTTSGDSFGPICGTESGSSQHIYMDLGQESGIGNTKREERKVVLILLCKWRGF